MGWELLVGGVAVGVTGGFSTSLAYFVMKRLHNRLLAEATSSSADSKTGSKTDVEGREHCYLPDKVPVAASGYFYCEWWLGVLLLVIGAVSGIANLGLLGQLAIAPFASFSLVFNALLGALLLHERYTIAIFCSSVLVVAGVVVSATQIHSDREDYSKDHLKDLFSRDWVAPLGISVLTYLFASSIVVFCLSPEGPARWWRLWQRCQMTNGSDNSTPDKPSKVPLLVDGVKSKTAFDFSRSCGGLLFYATTCGISSGLNSTILKVLVELVKAGQGKAGPLENVAGWEFWTILLCGLLPLITFQLWTLDQGLKRHTSVLMVPPMIGSIIIFNAIAGHIFFDEGTLYGRKEIKIFYMGLSVTVIGTLSVLFPTVYNNCWPGATSTAKDGDGDGGCATSKTKSG